ncbi:MAG: transposase [Spirochaetaceae bacterium]|jgi:REP element-mobilizing transposase RayT|nr:transposase [Spirochaetaceae bacterium]
MRALRELKQGVWYEIRTRMNNREPLFRRGKAVTLFDQVFGETTLRFAFTVCGLRLADDWLTFYIKPANGLKLPAIMQWLKQTFALRYNRDHGRIGHLWGDRYWSKILDGEPPDGAEEAGGAAAPSSSISGVSPRSRKRVKNSAFFLLFPLTLAPNPG